MPNVDLYDHQRLAIEQLKNGSILCAGVGTGKSRTALAYYFIKECGGSFPINGVGEYKPMQLKKDLYVITTAKKRDSKEWEQECIPFLMSDIVKVDSWNNIKKYTDVQNAFFIFDEQRVVGYGAWTKSFLKICRKNHWILLSATPGDTWMDYIPVFIANGFYRNKTEFLKRHVVFSSYVDYPRVERYLEVNRLAKLKEMILVNMDFIKPTEERHVDIHCNYSEEKYSIIKDELWNFYEVQPIRDAAQRVYLERKVVNSDKSRIEHLKELIDQHPKVIVFYNFDYELDILREFIKSNDLTKGELNGHMHQPLPKGDSWIYLVQYMAGAEAWNCIETNAMIFYSQNYSYKMMEQASGRISRMNTPYPVLYYYHFVSDSPIDKSINRALKRKKKFNENKYIASKL